jgi:peptidylprolyl isomerase
MKLKFPVIAAFVAMLSLTACGGGGGSGGSNSGSGVVVASPAQLVKTDTVVGTGNDVALGATLTTTYSVWLYSATAADNKGNKIDTGNLTFVQGAATVISGLEQGVAGMKSGGKRVLQIPASLAFGTTGNGSTIPANAGLVFEVELTSVVYPATGPTTLIKTDTVVGTGTEAAAGKNVTVAYTGWLYNAAAADKKGTQFDAGTFSFVMGSGKVIAGFDLGVTGMKVGGKRTVVIPYTLGYGSTANGTIPANSGLVFDIQLTNVQ